MAPVEGGKCEVKLCDFGIARELRDDVEVREVLGTPDYVGECGGEKWSLKLLEWFSEAIRMVLWSY